MELRIIRERIEVAENSLEVNVVRRDSLSLL